MKTIIYQNSRLRFSKTRARILVFLVLISMLLLSISSYAQLKIEPGRITIHADTMEVRQAFALLHYMIPKSQKIEKVVIKDGNEYRQSRWLINRMLKRYAYVNGGRLRKI